MMVNTEVKKSWLECVYLLGTSINLLRSNKTFLICITNLTEPLNKIHRPLILLTDEQQYSTCPTNTDTMGTTMRVLTFCFIWMFRLSLIVREIAV